MIVFLRRKGSPFAESLARVAGGGLAVLDLDAVEAGEPVRVEGERVLWQGTDLGAAGAVIVEELPFAWPQRLAGAAAVAGDDRPRRALALSALCAAAESVPMIDAPRMAHLAALPLSALSVLAERGVAVQPHRLATARPAADGSPGAAERTWLDVAGAVRGYAPSAPHEGEPAWSPEPFEGGVLRVLVVGESAVGALAFADGPAWAVGRHDGAVPGPELDAGARETALAAARALGSRAAEVSLIPGAGTVLCARPGPAWSRFESALGPCVPRALWEHALFLESR